MMDGPDFGPVGEVGGDDQTVRGTAINLRLGRGEIMERDERLRVIR